MTGAHIGYARDHAEADRPALDPILTIRQLMEKADSVVQARATNPRKAEKGWRVDFVVEEITKPHKAVKTNLTLKSDMLILPAFDPKAPGNFLVMVQVFNGKLSSFHGIETTPRLAEYAKKILKHRAKDSREWLRFYVDHLHDADRLVREDAQAEFSRAEEADQAEFAKKLPAEKIRALMNDPMTEPTEWQFLIYLLSFCGQAADADAILKTVNKNADSAKWETARRNAIAALIVLNPDKYAPKYRALNHRA